MKKTKLIPSILMLVLCTAVLAVGIYAASPTSHSVVGTVNISAGGANVSITGYLDDGDGDFSNDVKVTNTYTSRTAQTISIYANALDFDCASAFDISEVAEKKLYFKVQNHSSFSLGAYFLEGTVPEGGTTESNIAESKSFNGTMGTQTITNLITATFTPYSEVPANGSTNMYSTLKLNQLNAEASTVTLNLNLNIEKLNEELLPTDNTIKIANESNLNVSIACSVENANNATTTTTISKSGRWQAGELAFAETKYGNGELRLKTIKMSMLVANNGSEPISASVTEGDNNHAQDASKIKVTILNNSYIAPGKTGEVSVHFSAVYDRSSGAVTTVPEIGAYNYTVTVSKATTVSSTYVYDLITYDDDTTTNSMPTKGFKYYIEYGDNPYVPGTKLRWYVWAKDDGSGNPTALEASDKITDNGVKKLAKNNTYYFISEYILDSSSTQRGIPFQAEIYFGDMTNIYGDYVTDYAGSNVREYLNGLTVKNGYYDNSADDSTYNQHMPNGSDVNFLNTYNLTSDPLYALITGRSLESLYGDINYSTSGDTSSPFPTNNTDAKTTDTDMFWLPSYKEYYNLIRNGTDSNAVAYLASQAGTRPTNNVACWWLRTPMTLASGATVIFDGSTDYAIARDVSTGVRPAFKIQI